jgi:hypothetical protein
VKAWVRGTKQSDGSFVAQKVALKMAGFTGKVTAVNGSTFIVNADGLDKTVLTGANTSFPAGVPTVGHTVVGFAAKLGDGSYFAFEMKIKNDEPISFTGIIVGHNPGEFTILVDVGGVVKAVCYEFAAVEGILSVGATVFVEVDHIDAGTYFAGKVKVMS